jgi:hypothetical protein
MGNMRPPQTKTISGTKYTVTPLETSTGLKMLTRLLRILGPSVKDIRSFGDLKAMALVAFGSLAERLEDADVEAIVQTLAASTKVGNDPKKQPALSTIFELHFSGDYLPLFQWLAFALEVNFGTFFRELVAKGEIPGAPAGSAADEE